MRRLLDIAFVLTVLAAPIALGLLTFDDPPGRPPCVDSCCP